MVKGPTQECRNSRHKTFTLFFSDTTAAANIGTTLAIHGMRVCHTLATLSCLKKMSRVGTSSACGWNFNSLGTIKCLHTQFPYETTDDHHAYNCSGFSYNFLKDMPDIEPSRMRFYEGIVQFDAE